MLVPDPKPGAEQLAGISDLALALSCGSAKLCEALLLLLGEHDPRSLLAEQINLQLQTLVLELSRDANPASILPI
jgi:hypothetical protein